MSLRIDNAVLIDPHPEGATVLEANSLRVQEDRIEEIGTSLPEADTVIDAEQGILIPGLVNAHGHVPMTLFRGVADDLPLKRWLRDAIWPLEAHLTPQAVRAGAELGIAEMLAAGITGFADMYLFEEEVAAAAEHAGIRCLAGASIVDFDTPDGDADDALDRAQAHLEAYPPGSEGLVEASIAPHSTYTCSRETLEATAELADDHEARLQTHCSETRHEVYHVEKGTGHRPVAQLEATGCLSERTLLAHAGWITKQEATVLADAGTSVVHCPTANMKLATGGTCPVPELVDQGARVALGSDGVASNNTIDLLQEAKQAALVHKQHRWQADVLPAGDVLRMATREGAAACGFAESGRLVEGAAADLALIDASAAHMAPLHDAVSQVVYAARAGDVRSTIVDGALVFHEGTHRTLDLGERRREGERWASTLLKERDG